MAARRASYWLPVAFLLCTLFPGVASAQGAGPFCAPAGSATENCIVQDSLTVNGGAPPSNISASLQFNAGTGAYTLMFTNTSSADPFELAPTLTAASVVTVTFKMAASASDPRLAISTGLISSWSINTTPNPNEVTITVSPRATSWARANEPPLPPEEEPPGGCTPEFCEQTADVDYQALLLAAFDPMAPPPSPPQGFTDFSDKIKGWVRLSTWLAVLRSHSVVRRRDEGD